MTADLDLHPHGSLVHEASECARPDLLGRAGSRPARRNARPSLHRRPWPRGATVLTLVTLCAALASFVAWIL